MDSKIEDMPESKVDSVVISPTPHPDLMLRAAIARLFAKASISIDLKSRERRTARLNN